MINIARIRYYFKIWLVMSKNSFIVMLTQKKIFLLFLVGKILRFVFFASFIVFIVRESNTLAGFGSEQILFFFLTFTLVDVIAQYLFREVYRFRPLLVSGDFDTVLSKPYNALFRVLMGGVDLIDLVTIPPLIFIVVYVANFFDPSLIQTLMYVLLIINSLLIAAALHVVILAFGIVTMEVDHIIWIYRDITNLGRLPVDIYKQPLRGFITFLIPVGIMMTIPAKALAGLVSPSGVLLSFVVGIFAIFISLRFWNFAIKRYTSASS